MKKILAVLCALCVAASFAVFAACNGGNDETSSAGSSSESTSDVSDSSSEESSVTVNYQISVNTTEAVVFTATSDVLAFTDSTSLKDYLDVLVSAGQITYDGYVSEYGYYITTVNGNAEQYYDTYMTFWSIYTDLFTLDGVTYATTDYGSYESNGTTLGSSSYGAESLPCIEGYTYALVYSTYTYST